MAPISNRSVSTSPVPWLWAMAMAIVAAGGCAMSPGSSSTPSRPQIMRDPQADFSSYRTFGWSARPASAAPASGGPPVSLLDRQLRGAIAAELLRRGYAEAAPDAMPDLRMTFETSGDDKVRNSPVRVGVGVGSWGGNVGGSVNVGGPVGGSYREGELVVRAIDNARNTEVWQSRVTRKRSKRDTGPEAVERDIKAALAEFPRRNQ